MSDYQLEAQLREATGRADSRRMRRAGLVPAIIYGGDKPDLPITLSARTLGKVMQQEHFFTSMIDIQVKGSTETVLLKEAQWHPVKDTVDHIDFLRASSEDVVTVHVPVHATNYAKAPGIVRGGAIEMVCHELTIQARADSIPDHIDIDCSMLDIGATIHVNDIVPPAGVKIPHEQNFAVLHISPPKTEAAATPAA